MQSHKINIVIVDDHPIVIEGLKIMLSHKPFFHLSKTFNNGGEVIQFIKSNEVDIILLDISLPDISGIQLCEEIKKVSPNTSVIMFSNRSERSIIMQCIQNGASGYLLKNVSSDELVFAIKHVHIGGRYICSELSLRLLDKLIHMPDVSLVNGVHDFELSSKEHEVLTLISEGFTNQEIADKVFTSKRTIEGYRQSLMSKTGSRNMAALIKFAVINRLIN
ncbi:MAG: response regulator transcription factor [Sphingobacteriaceae bacterium]|nr:MAG: response regulator transcription factor [Sphingobacteriaceae bacterium]